VFNANTTEPASYTEALSPNRPWLDQRTFPVVGIQREELAAHFVGHPIQTVSDGYWSVHIKIDINGIPTLFVVDQASPVFFTRNGKMRAAEDRQR